MHDLNVGWNVLYRFYLMIQTFFGSNIALVTAMGSIRNEWINIQQNFPLVYSLDLTF